MSEATVTVLSVGRARWCRVPSLARRSSTVIFLINGATLGASQGWVQTGTIPTRLSKRSAFSMI